jgi:hypothetical protein
MADKVRVFVCYKKVLSRQEGGESIRERNTDAAIFNFLLSQHQSYDPWIDDAELAAGMEWESEIYRHLIASDILVVLIGPGTSQSEWVRREIALASALGISVVPVGSRIAEEQMTKETKDLSIDRLQYVITHNIDLQRGPALLAELDGPLQQAVQATRKRQRDVLGDLWSRQASKPIKAPDNKKAAAFNLDTGYGSIVLYVASGDVAKIRRVDALVNSENDYMQMARFFESWTVSSILRRRGARMKDGRYQDTIQQELDWQLRARGRPVQASEVFATSAGGPDSDLAKINKVRVILHVAAVQAVDAERRVIPYKYPGDIEASVRRVLSVMADLNEKSGVFSPEGSDQRAEQEQLAAAGKGQLKSVLFPLLGTGQGGAETSQVIDPMVEGLVGYLSDSDNVALTGTLEEVYISAYSQDDLDTVKAVLGKRLAAVSSS